MPITINGSGTVTGLSVGGLPDGSVAVSDIAATGTPSSSTFLRGDGSWQAFSFSGSQGQVFTSNGTFTIPTGITAVKITVIGGGGRGGASNFYTPSGCGAPTQFNAGGGGGSGGCAIRYLTGLTPGNTLAVTIGAGGTSTSGGNSTVASGTQTVTTTTGGGGSVGGDGVGNASGGGAGGAGGTATNGTINIPGGNGMPGQATSANFYATASSTLGGNGGNSLLGAGGLSASTGSVYGGGGGGGSNGTRGNGSAGVVIFEW